MIYLYNYYKKNKNSIPEEFRQKVKDEKTEQLIIDYIAGMSDVYAINKGKELFIPTPWLNNRS